MRSPRGRPIRAVALFVLLSASACGARSSLRLEEDSPAPGGAGGGDSGAGSGSSGAGGSGDVTGSGSGGGAPSPCGFSARFGDLYAQYPTSMAVDATGAVVVAGSFFGSLDFGDRVLDSGSTETSPVIGGAVFLARLDPQGETLWSHGYGLPEASRAASMAVDGDTNIFIAASTSEGIDFGNGEIAPDAGVDAVLAKVSPAGDAVWSRLLLADSASYQGVGVLSIGTDAAGNVVVFGVATSDHRYLFLTKIDPSGGDVWTRTFAVDEGALITQDRALAVDAQGGATLLMGVQALGDTEIDLGGGPLRIPDQANNSILARFDASGALVYARLVDGLGGVGNDWAGAGPVVLGASGDAYVSLPFGGTIDAGTGALTAEGGESMLVLHVDAAGRTLFARAFGSEIYAGGMALGAGGRLLLGGTLEGSADFADDALVNGDDASDVFFAVLDAASGAPLEARGYGVGAGNILQLAVQPQGSVVVSGILLGELQLCEEVLRSEGSTDVFVAQLEP